MPITTLWWAALRSTHDSNKTKWHINCIVKIYSIYNKIIISILTIVFIVGNIFVFVSKTNAAFNRQINYQGKLTNSSNIAVADGLYTVEFKLYTQPTGGSAIWTETNSGANRVQVTGGLFSVMMGSTTPFTGVDFNQTLYLGVKIESDSEMTPRKVIGVVPAAFVADTLNGISSNQFLRADIQNSTSSSVAFLNILQNGVGKIAEFFGPGSNSALAILSGGNIGVGTTTPTSKLSVVGDTYLSGNVTATGTLTVLGTATSTMASTVVPVPVLILTFPADAAAVMSQPSTFTAVLGVAWLLTNTPVILLNPVVPIVCAITQPGRNNNI